MAFTYVLTNDIGRVRLLIPDNQEPTHIFEDEEISVFLESESTVRNAAALALEIIASNEAYTLKAIRVLDMQTDGTKVSDALLKRAALLRAQSDEEDDDSFFEIAEFADTPFGRREIVEKRLWAGEL